MKSLRTRGVWHKSLEELHSAQIKEKSLLGHLVCSEETQRKILESEIFRILEPEGVRVQRRFGDSKICLNFRKQIGPFRNGRKPIFLSILLPEFISDQGVRLAFSNFGEVVSVFKGRHEFNRKIRNGKMYFKIFPAGGDPAILPRKISFHGRIQKDVLFAEKEMLCYRCKTRHMLGQNTPTTEESGMPLKGQSDTPGENFAPVRPE